MSEVVYDGLYLQRSDLQAAVMAALGGRVPGDNPRAVDALDWLDGLVVLALQDEEPRAWLAESVDIALRTGSSDQVARMAELAARRPALVPPETLRALLDEGRILRHRETGQAVARTVCAALVEGRLAYAEDLRGFLGMPWLRQTFGPAWAVFDEDWYFENLHVALSNSPDVLERRLETLWEVLPPDAYHEVARRLRGCEEAFRARAWPRVVEVLDRHAAARPTAPVVEAPELPASEPDHAPHGAQRVDAPAIAALDAPRQSDSRPWRGQDGRWFRIPPLATLLPGPYLIVRGRDARGVRAAALVSYEISADDAAFLLSVDPVSSPKLDKWSATDLAGKKARY